MRMRLAVIAAVLAVSGCASDTSAPDATPEGTVTHSARVEPSVGTGTAIDTHQALTIALEKVGITDVHPIATPAGEPLAAWAAVPKFKACPIYLQVSGGDAWMVSHMQDASGTIKPIDMEGYAISPSAADMVSWAMNNPRAVLGCMGDKTPGTWPTGPPTK